MVDDDFLARPFRSFEELRPKLSVGDKQLRIAVLEIDPPNAVMIGRNIVEIWVDNVRIPVAWPIVEKAWRASAARRLEDPKRTVVYPCPFVFPSFLRTCSTSSDHFEWS